MPDKKKAALSVAALKAAGETAALSETAISTKDSTIKTSGAQAAISGRAVSALLHAGRKNALPLRDLCQLAGMDGRQVRLMIQRERLKGAPILSDNQSGYYLPGNEGEIREFVRSMRHRAGEIEKAAGAIEGAYYGK